MSTNDHEVLRDSQRRAEPSQIEGRAVGGQVSPLAAVDQKNDPDRNLKDANGRPLTWTNEGGLEAQQQSANEMIKAHQAERKGRGSDDQHEVGQSSERDSERRSKPSMRDKYAALREQRAETMELSDDKLRARDEILSDARSFEQAERTRESHTKIRGDYTR